MDACSCAIAVKSGDDVILVDVCGPAVGATTRKPIFTIKLYLNGELTPETEVISHGGGKTYEVWTQKGTFRIQLNFWKKNPPDH